MKNFELIKAHLADNTGDENISKMVWLVIVFVVGAVFMAVFTTVFDEESLSGWFVNSLNNIMNGGTEGPAAFTA